MPISQIFNQNRRWKIGIFFRGMSKNDIVVICYTDIIKFILIGSQSLGRNKGVFILALDRNLAFSLEHSKSVSNH